MSVSAAAAVPATVATLAYLNARWQLPADWLLFSNLAWATADFRRRERADRANSFYLLEKHALDPKTGDKPFLVYEARTWTFKQAYDITLRYAGYLHSTHSVTAGEIVALDFMNCPEFLFLTLGLWSLGARPALINYNLVGAPLLHSVRTSTARLLLVDPEIEAKVLTSETMTTLSSPTFRNNALPLTMVILNVGLKSSLEYFPPYRAPDSARSGAIGRSPCGLIYTSGTTGLPKPAVIHWEKLGLGSGFCARWQGLRPVTHKKPDRFYTAMPLYHGTAFMLGFHMCLWNASTFVLGHKFSVSSFWPEVRAKKVTVIQYVGETLRYLLAAPVQKGENTNHQVRMAFGNGLRPDVWDQFKQRFGIDTIAEFYGATEGPGASWNLSRNSSNTGAIGQYGAIGQLIIRASQTIVKVDWETEVPYRNPTTGLCERVAPGAVGELLFLLDANDLAAKYQGYHNNSEASASKILHNVLKKGDAYFRSGDVVRLDSDGRLWFSDRIGDTFRWKSENVSTAEVGEVLGHHPLVLEANVYGVSIPGHEGRAGCATLLMRDEALVAASNPGAGGGSPEIKNSVLENLATYATNSLPRFGVPVFLRVVREVIATGNNKQQKHILRKEGVDPDLVQGGDRIYWLRPGQKSYELFGRAEWDSLRAGKARL